MKLNQELVRRIPRAQEFTHVQPRQIIQSTENHLFEVFAVYVCKRSDRLRAQTLGPHCRGGSSMDLTSGLNSLHPWSRDRHGPRGCLCSARCQLCLFCGFCLNSANGLATKSALGGVHMQFLVLKTMYRKIA